MGSVDLPYLNLKRAKGRQYAYYRRDGKTTRIKAEIGTPAFLQAYAEIHAEADRAHKPAPGRPAGALPWSLRALIVDYKSSGEFKQMAPATRKSYLWVLEWLLPKYGDLPVRELPKSWILRRRAELSDTPGKANYFVTVMSVLLTFGGGLDYCDTNVAAKIKRLRTGESYRAWTDHEIETMTSHKAGLVKLPVLLALYSGQRRADVASLLGIEAAQVGRRERAGVRLRRCEHQVPHALQVRRPVKPGAPD